MQSHKKVSWILFVGLSFGVMASPTWSVEEGLKGPGNPERLEKELQHLLSVGIAESNDPTELSHLASLYLDLGYGFYVDREKKLVSFQEGARLAKKALEQEESSVNAHFLYAANLGKVMQLQGVVAAAFNLQIFKKHVDRILELDETYAPAHHMLGRLYEELPWFLGRDLELAGEYLKKAISLDVYYAPARLDLGRWYVAHGRYAEAEKEFLKVIQTPPLEKRWIWERIHQPQAQKLLQQIGGSASPHSPE